MLASPFTKPPLRIHNLLDEALKRETNIHRLHKAISQANEEAKTRCVITRPMLTRILSRDEKVGYTWTVLVALDTYLRKHDASLQHLPFLVSRGVLEALAHPRPLYYMFGAKPRPEERRTDISQWDMLALSEVQAQAAQHGVTYRFDTANVLWRSVVDPTAIGSEDWFRILNDDQASVISFGSPLAALSSEYMLAQMFGVKPFERPHFSIKAQLPFFFVWLSKLTENFNSAFGLSWRELVPDHPELSARVKTCQATAFMLGETVHESPVEATEWSMHGVIAAQRRAAGNIWMVVAGLAGPATYGAATVFKQIADELPWSVNRPSKVLWVPVKVLVRAGKAKPTDGDIREVIGTEFVGAPRLWPEH